jgi:hypothetical protein
MSVINLFFIMASFFSGSRVIVVCPRERRYVFLVIWKKAELLIRNVTRFLLPTQRHSITAILLCRTIYKAPLIPNP